MKNEYAKKLAERKALEEYYIKQWTAQMCLDCIGVVLNEELGVGSERLKKISEKFNEIFPECLLALTKDNESDYLREKIDRRLKQIMKEDFVEWDKRYEGWKGY